MVNPDYTGMVGFKAKTRCTDSVNPTTTTSSVYGHITILPLFVLSDESRCFLNKDYLIDVGILQVSSIFFCFASAHFPDEKVKLWDNV